MKIVGKNLKQVQPCTIYKTFGAANCLTFNRESWPAPISVRIKYWNMYLTFSNSPQETKYGIDF